MSEPWVMPWDADLDTILAGLQGRGIDLRTDPAGTVLREAMVEAWQFGYTAGMADSERLDRRGMGFLHQPPDQR